jgi:hypothetical protein
LLLAGALSECCSPLWIEQISAWSESLSAEAELLQTELREMELWAV